MQVVVDSGSYHRRLLWIGPWKYGSGVFALIFLSRTATEQRCRRQNMCIYSYHSFFGVRYTRCIYNKHTHIAFAVRPGAHRLNDTASRPSLVILGTITSRAKAPSFQAFMMKLAHHRRVRCPLSTIYQRPSAPPESCMEAAYGTAYVER